MNTQKVAISMPKGLVAIIDTISKKNGVSRSKFISSVLYEKVMDEKNKAIREAYDTVFSDELICKEQLDTSKWFENTDDSEGQEW